MNPRRVRAVVFDLDDTLFPQAQWLAGAWKAVAAAAAAQGVDPVALEAALVAEAAGGSGRGGIIDRALAAVAAPGPMSLDPLLEAFWNHRPAHLDTYPGVPGALVELRRRALLGLVTDGEPRGQRAKMEAAGVAGLFDAVVLSDELGREHRKPDPAPFRAVLDDLGVGAEETVFVGDRPDKDVAGPAAVGMWTVRVHTGEYADVPDVPKPWRSVEDVPAAARLLEPWLGPPTR